MINYYETPEVVEIGRAQDMILGRKQGPDTDPESGEPVNFDIVLDEIE